MAFVLGLIIWLVVSLPFAILLGKFFALGSRYDATA